MKETESNIATRGSQGIRGTGFSKEQQLSARNETTKQVSSPLPVIHLPKGGGAIRGIGEKFTANPVTGTASLNVPIATSPGCSGFGPQLSLSYDSGSGNGPFGFGWNLSLPSITRKTEKGLPKYQDGDDSDTFILSGTEDLVAVLKKQGNDWIPEDVPDRTRRNLRVKLHVESPVWLLLHRLISRTLASTKLVLLRRICQGSALVIEYVTQFLTLL